MHTINQFLIPTALIRCAILRNSFGGGITVILAMMVLISESVAQIAPRDDLNMAFGFCRGQSLSLKRIKREFPNLSAQVNKVELEFHLTFGIAELRIKKALQDIFKENYSDYESQISSQTKSIVNSQELSEEKAIKFISEVEARVKGNILSPILETLLIYQFFENPAEEFLRNFTNVYRTNDHPKAKGIDLHIQYPKSWQQKEGDSPNIVQFFQSENGRGFEILTLLIKEITDLPPDNIFTTQEIEEFFSETSLKGMLPEDAIFIYKKPIVLDNYKGVMILYDQILKRLEYSFNTRCLQYMTLFRNKMIIIEFTFSTKPGKDSDLQQRFTKYELLFKMIANSFVIHN